MQEETGPEGPKEPVQEEEEAHEDNASSIETLSEQDVEEALTALAGNDRRNYR